MAADWEGSIKVLGGAGYINAFFDWFPIDPDPPVWPLSTLSEDERMALGHLKELMEEAAKAPWTTDAELIATGWPQQIEPIAGSCLSLLLVRGRFSEDVEQD